MRTSLMLAGLMLLGTPWLRADNVPAPDPLPKPNMDWTDGQPRESGLDRDERREGRRPREGFRSDARGWRVRVLQASGLARVFPEDEVVVIRCPAEVTVELPSVMSGVEGRALVIKSAVDAGGDVVVHETDVGDVVLKPGQSVMLVSSSQLREWLVVSRQ